MPDIRKAKPENCDAAKDIRYLRYLLEEFGHLPLGERCSQLEHARQCAALAQAEGAARPLVCAAFLHDIGHLQALHLLLPGTDDEGHRDHDRIGAQLLCQLGFSESVFVPVAKHVEAKRFLAACDGDYIQHLSPASKRSLQLQGDTMSSAERSRFLLGTYAQDAIALRLWDEAGKCDSKAIAEMDYWLDLCELELTAGIAAKQLPQNITSTSLESNG
ncbi:HD domain-containing protein [Microbulbifer pacificus]|uniref:HD domain-containing protein n=1 Tax=Microbulbifer pacificus TaxID=407164 RepID=A0AAU0MZX6_9GAMM|nr:HD domain-containing protein [Microbulbifer pacificus]WOX04984.1 HD domain-containing protein [Microbulbifer pacificus]